MRVYAALLTASLGFLASCKVSPEQQVARVKDDTSAAPSGTADRCNLAKTKLESDEAALKQLECVSKVVDAVGPAWVKAVKNAIELGVAINELTSLKVDMSEDPADAGTGSSDTSGSTGTATGPSPSPSPSPSPEAPAGDVPADEQQQNVSQDGLSLDDATVGGATLTAWELVNNVMTELSQGRKLKPRWLDRCVGSVTATSTSLQEMAKGISELAEKKSLSLETAKSLIDSVTSGTVAMFQLGNAMISCAPPAGAKESVGAMRRSIEKLVKAGDGLKSALGAIDALYTCGVNIRQGLIVLANNTSCLMDDLAALKASDADLKAARDRLLTKAQPNPGGDYTKRCNQEDNNCNMFLFTKYGVWASRNIGTFSTRRGACEDFCGNAKPSRNKCRANASAFLDANDVEACSGICDETQCDAAIAACVSQCCGQDGSCAKAADKNLNVDTETGPGRYSREEKRATGKVSNYQVRCDLGGERCDIQYIDYKVIEATIHVNVRYKCPSYNFGGYSSGYVALGNNAAEVKKISDEIGKFNANNELSLVSVATLSSYVVPGGTGGFSNCAADQ